MYKSFEEFLNDVWPKPWPEYSIDRIDVNGNYEPSNCRWITMEEQAKNKTYNFKKHHKIEYFKKTDLETIVSEIKARIIDYFSK